MENKITVRDLINIGVFTALYLGLTISTILVSSIVFLTIFMPIMAALLAAPIYLLFIAKTQKPFCILIMGLICSTLYGLLSYGNVICFAVNMVFFLTADGIAFLGKYKNFKINAISCIVASYWTMGEIGTFWFLKDFIYKLSIDGGYPQEWVDVVMSFATIPNLIIILVGISVSAMIGILFTKNMFKKHFVRAGIV